MPGLRTSGRSKVEPSRRPLPTLPQTCAMAAVLPILLLLHALGAGANVTYCWGAGSTGQLGDGQGGGGHTQAVPTAVSSAPEFAAVQAGAQHTCGLTAAGQAYCWVRGRLCMACKLCSPALTVEAASLHCVTARAAPACLLSSTDVNHCWLPVQGQALDGELGVGAVNGSYLAVPTPVAGNLTFTSLSLGDKFSCGIADGRAQCWVRGAGHCSNAPCKQACWSAAVRKLLLCFPTCLVQACQPTCNQQAMRRPKQLPI